MKEGAKRTSRERKGRTDWKRITRLSDAQIERMAAQDPDNPATKREDCAEAFIGMPPDKTPVNANFDIDVVQWFKSQGVVTRPI